MRIACSVALALVAGTHGASAEPSATSAAATAEFDRGRAFAKDGNWGEACTAFERSEKLEAAFGTLYNLAGCYVHVGRLASAWAAYRELAQRDTNAGRRADAARQAELLEPRLPRLTIAIASKPVGLVVSIDGVDVTSLVGADSPIDLGAHTIRADAPGFEHWETTATISEERATPTVTIALVRAMAPPPPPRTPTVEAAPASSRRSYAVIVGVAGVALAATGLVLGDYAKRAWDDAKQVCGADLHCDSDAELARAQQLLGDARLRANIATGLTIGGAATIVAGAVLWLTAPSRRAHVAIQAGATWGLSVEAGF